MEAAHRTGWLAGLGWLGWAGWAGLAGLGLQRGRLQRAEKEEEEEEESCEYRIFTTLANADPDHRQQTRSQHYPPGPQAPR